MKRSLAAIVALLLGWTLASCAMFSDDYDETKGWSAAKLYSEAKQNLNDRNYDQARRLVDHDERVVFKCDRQGQRLRLMREGFGHRRRSDPDLLSAPDPLLGLRDGAAHMDLAQPHPAADPAARMLREQARKRLIQAQTGELAGNDELQAPRVL